MALKFSAAEVLEMAMELEKKGMAFYQNLAGRARDGMSKELFTFLHDEEERHLSYFSEMFKSLGQSTSSSGTMDETIDYLGALIENGVLGKVLKGIDLTEGDSSVSRALDIGMLVEKESTLFYQAMEPMVPKGKLNLLQGIIQEEKKHLIKLNTIKQDLVGQEG